MELSTGSLSTISKYRDQILAKTLRTRELRGFNIWLRIDGDYPEPCKLKSVSHDKNLGEWRSTGNYTVIHGKHPDGCDYQMLVDQPVVTIAYKEINWPPDNPTTAPLGKAVVGFVAVALDGALKMGGNDVVQAGCGAA